MKKAITILLLILSISVLVGQNVEKLKAKKSSLNKDIANISKILNEVRSKQKTSVTELKLIEKQLGSREKLLSTLQDEFKLINTEIKGLEMVIRNSEESLNHQKEEYAKMIRHAYSQKGDLELLTFILSSETFNDAFHRMQYIRKINQYRLEKVTLIKEEQQDLLLQKEQMKASQLIKEQLIVEEENEQQKFRIQQLEKNKVVSELQKEEGKYKRELDEKQRAINLLEKEIRSIIEANKKPESQPKKKEPRNTSTTTIPPKKNPEIYTPPAPKVGKLSAEFAKNKGGLPWPVDKGVITGRFGKQKHSQVNTVQIDNTGIDISVPKGSAVRAVFSGEVNTIIYSPVFQSAIIVKHGEYYTVYSNLKEVYVQKNEVISEGQSIGAVYTNEDSVTEVHFEVWKSSTNLNPATWLKRR